MPRAFACRLVAAVVLGFSAAMPAKAEIEKFMNQCDGKLCASFRASITIPDGWVEDKEASDYFKAQMLLPKGLDFDKAPAKIYALVRYNRAKQPITDFLPDSIKDWKSRAKDAKINRLDDLARHANRRSCATRLKHAASRSRATNCRLSPLTATRMATNSLSP